MSITGNVNPTVSKSLQVQSNASIVSIAGTITIATVTLNAVGSVGTLGGRILTAASTLSVTSTTGSIFVQETDAITLGNIAASEFADCDSGTSAL